MIARSLSFTAAASALWTVAALTGCNPPVTPEAPKTPQQTEQPDSQDTPENTHTPDAELHNATADIQDTPEDADMTYELSKTGPMVMTHCEAAQATVYLLKDNKPYRVFSSEVDLMGNQDSKVCIQLLDLNFDNIQDILIPTSIGMHNTYYRAWLWNSNSGAFEEIPDFSKLGAPILHPESQSLEFSTHISAAEYELAEYRLEGKTPVLWRAMHVAHDADTDRFTVTSRINQAGQILEKTDKLSAEELNDLSLRNLQPEE